MHPETSPPSPARAVALAVASAALLTAAFPPVDVAAAGWIALTPLIRALHGAPARLGLVLGWVTGSLAALGTGGVWIAAAAHGQLGLSPVAAALFAAGVTQALVSPFFALFGLCVALVGRAPWRLPAIPACLVALEWLRTQATGGLTWGLLGHSQTAPVLLQVCDLAGTYGLSYLLAFTAAAVAEWPARRGPLVAAACLAATVAAYGVWTLGAAGPSGGQLPVAVVLARPASVATPDAGDSPDGPAARYAALTAGLSPLPPLVVWSADPVGAAAPGSADRWSRLAAVLTPTASRLLVSGEPAAVAPSAPADAAPRAYLVGGEGRLTAIGPRAATPVLGGCRSPRSPAEGPTGFVTLAQAGARPFAVLPGADVAVAGVARDAARQGAAFLVSLGNDRWFAAGAGPAQLYRIARFRAVENRVGILRVARDGPGGAIDPLGRTVTDLPADVDAAIRILLPIGRGDSFHARHGDLFAVLCGVAALQFLARVPLLRARRREAAPGTGAG